MNAVELSAQCALTVNVSVRMAKCIMSLTWCLFSDLKLFPMEEQIVAFHLCVIAAYDWMEKDRKT